LIDDRLQMRGTQDHRSNVALGSGFSICTRLYIQYGTALRRSRHRTKFSGIILADDFQTLLVRAMDFGDAPLQRGYALRPDSRETSPCSTAEESLNICTLRLTAWTMSIQLANVRHKGLSSVHLCLCRTIRSMSTCCRHAPLPWRPRFDIREG
jgi:hypothetical protein